MKTAIQILNAVLFAIFFFEYAVAMEPPQPAGTRRFLQTYAGQISTGAYPMLKPVWEMGYKVSDRSDVA
jgi:hypothetical protein